MSGDAHVAAVFELRPGLYEITASPISASGPPMNTFAHKVDKILFSQPEFKLSRGQQFALVDVDTESSSPMVTIQIISNSDRWATITITPAGLISII